MSDLTDKMIAAGLNTANDDRVRSVASYAVLTKAIIAAALRVLEEQQFYLCDSSYDDVRVIMCDTLADEIEASS